MRAFLFKAVLALLILAAMHVAAAFQADGSLDEFYLRFTTPRQKSLVLGGSRAAQGIHPSLFGASDADALFEGPLYDFAFTIAHSPYGPTYLRAISAKLDTTARDGLFILQVDPWLLGNSGHDEDGREIMPEEARTLGRMWTFNMYPNLEYLTRYHGQGWGTLGHWPMGDPDTTSELLSDGRLRMRIPMDSAAVAERTRRKIRHYAEEVLPNTSFSETRETYLARIIDLLSPHGTVLLVRFPAVRRILDMEDRLDPAFDARMERIAAGHHAHYLDVSRDAARYTYTDGNHLDSASGAALTRFLSYEAGRLRALE
ncbi:MAG: hypothetical protein KA791_12760 [Flavobacteriales bacterium]|nr:hypothetical protein [Flavobacteriales bacterium]